MKIRILDRILVALAGLMMLAGCALAAAQLFFGKNVTGRIEGLLEDPGARIYLIIGLALLVLIGLYCLLLLFRHKGRKEKFILQKTENGELSISLKAMESMIQKCLAPHKELTAQSVHLENQKGGLQVRIRGTVAGGVSIPLTVEALQQQIKQYVTACSGVEVKNIKVQIETSGPDAKDALFAIEAPASPALLNAADKSEAPRKEPAREETPMTPEEIEKVLAEMPAPNPSDDEDSHEPVPVSAAAAAAAEMVMSEVPPEDDDRPIHQRLFSNPEEPCVMPMPPEDIRKPDVEDVAFPKPSDNNDGEPENDSEGEPAEETDHTRKEGTDSHKEAYTDQMKGSAE